MEGICIAAVVGIVGRQSTRQLEGDIITDIIIGGAPVFSIRVVDAILVLPDLLADRDSILLR